MSVFKNGTFYHYEFQLDGRRHRGSTGTTNKQLAINEERRQRERLAKSYGQIIEEETREQVEDYSGGSRRIPSRLQIETLLRDVRRVCPWTRKGPRWSKARCR